MGNVVEVIAWISCIVVWIRLWPFVRLPKFPFKQKSAAALPSVTIIIPARNEANNLSSILDSLLHLDCPQLEIIVVDDASEDHTRQIAESYNVRVISLSTKPVDWVGKSWASYCGALQAKGDLILFTDA